MIIIAEKVRSHQSPPTRICYNEVNGQMNVEIVNSSKRYSEKELLDYGEYLYHFFFLQINPFNYFGYAFSYGH